MRAKQAPSISPQFRFDGKNEAAQKAASKQAAKMVTRVSRETKAAIRTAVVGSIKEGVAPLVLARQIRDMVGMNERQTRAARNHRRELEKMGVDAERVDELMQRYVDKKIRERAEMIARTEIMDSLNDGMLAGWEQAQEEGLLSNSATKEVIVTPLDDLCPICEELGDEEPIALDAMFETDDGEFSAPPFHPHCRCTLAVNP